MKNTQTNHYRIKSKQGNVISVNFDKKYIKPLVVKYCSICAFSDHKAFGLTMYTLLNGNLICNQCLDVGADLNRIS